MLKTKKLAASLFSGALIFAGVAVPSAGAQPVVTGGLVNVTITDVIDDVTVVVRDVNVGVGVAANIAAVVCPDADITAAVLGQAIARDASEITCTVGDQVTTFSPVQR
jgi:hypothetical protein